MDIEKELINEANFANKVTGCSIKQHISMRAAVEIRKLRELIKKDGGCKKCGGVMHTDGIALEQTFCGRPDFAGGNEQDAIIKKPPLGLIPKEIFQQNRALDIIAAMDRYVRADKPIPRAWITELDSLYGSS
jgi:hypothetical protein